MKEKKYILLALPMPMKNTLHPEEIGPITYLKWPLRLLLSIIVAHLITVEGQSKSSWQLFHQLNYWVALTFSVVASFLLIQMVHWITKWLDRKYDWVRSWLPRVLLQFVLGILLVLALDILFIRGYFWVFNNDFDKSGYMTVEFPIIKWMVLSLNILYVAWFFAAHYFASSLANHQLSSELDGFYQMREKQEGYQYNIEAKLGNKVVMVLPQEVLCFEREENVGYVWMKDGRKYNIDLKMQELAELLNPLEFYQISRSLMFSLSAIKGYEKVKNKQANLILLDDFEIPLPLLVSRYRFDGFKKAFVLSRQVKAKPL
ncbi:hypothetical protein GM921_09895 [Pedobacter sp. LMG 31464]|uniref:HTH LytTR-type domain-containing protein n=2 Tax=Pedobacter planticolens TaxID=2679964 RepID=A0A923IW40_9SPHI|nr:hypothetical protein [Pedobacter planticolens]